MDAASIGVLVGTAGMLAGTWVLVIRARNARIPYQLLAGMAIACALLLVFLTISDWPETWLNDFWTDHSIVGGLLTTLLLAGVAFFGFEARELHDQERLSDQIAGTAFGGLVNPLVVVDSALLLLARPVHDFPAGWQDGKPLRWVRSDGRYYEPPADDDPGSDADTDRPEIDLTTIFEAPDLAANVGPLIEQCIRRLVSAARNWAALASASADGRALLAQFGHLRNDLTALRVSLEDPQQSAVSKRLWARLRAELQLTSLVLEVASGAPATRPALVHFPTSTVEQQEPLAAARVEDLRERIRTPHQPTKSVRTVLAEELEAAFEHT